MRTFVDATGRTWTVIVNVNAVKRVRDLLKEDLLDVSTILPRLLLDPILLCDVLYVICKPQADKMGVSDEEFGSAMAGDVIAQAKSAFLEEYVDFFPDQNQRETLRLAIKKSKMLEERVKQLAMERLNSPKLVEEIEAALSTIGESSMN
ncbi:MAG: hypothetical protein WBH86_04895 [Thermogutta sp.]